MLVYYMKAGFTSQLQSSGSYEPLGEMFPLCLQWWELYVCAGTRLHEYSVQPITSPHLDRNMLLEITKELEPNGIKHTLQCHHELSGSEPGRQHLLGTHHVPG